MIFADNTRYFWIIGAIVFVISSIVLYYLNDVLRRAEYNASGLASATIFLICLTAISGGFWLIFHHPFRKIIIDRNAETVEVKQRSFVKMSQSEYELKDIFMFDVGKMINESGDDMFRVELVLKNGQRIPLASKWTNSREFCRNTANEAEDFIRK
ncbi:MAG: hypothetical protein H7Z37_04165 [Pyrinomonadaceae bacterium]|nr:hypothetical protein [Pyrinomonadaceae bacterium]